MFGWVTLAGPRRHFPAGNQGNEHDVVWELSPPWGSESSPSPAFPCPVPGQRGRASGTPARGTPARSLGGKEKETAWRFPQFWLPPGFPSPSTPASAGVRTLVPAHAVPCAHGSTGMPLRLPAHTYVCTHICASMHARVHARLRVRSPLQTGPERHVGPQGPQTPSCERAAVGRHGQPPLWVPLLRDMQGPLRGTQTAPAHCVGTTEPGAADTRRVALRRLPPTRCPEHRCPRPGWMTAVTSSSVTFP